MTNKPIIPTTEEVLSTMEAELHKARCIVLTEIVGTDRCPRIFRIDAISSCRIPGRARDRTNVVTIDGDRCDVSESLCEVLTRIARVEKDR